MNQQQVQEIIDLEIKNNFAVLSQFNIVVSFIKPLQQIYSNFDSTKTCNLWTVFIENKNGYRIYFDEKTNYFGLGIICNNDKLIDIGNYGTLFETIKAM